MRVLSPERALRTAMCALALLGWGQIARAADELPEAAMSRKSPQLVAEVAAGKRTVANAAWWGFDEADSTRALQEAIDSKVAKLLVPNMGKDWVVARTIRLVSNQQIVFQPGVVVAAMKGKFRSRGEALFRAWNVENVKLRGSGAVFRMRKADYQHPPYEKSEWRHALSICGCRGVEVFGLVLCQSGGDGIYVSSTPRRNCCKDVHIKDVTCDGNHRQGLSVISAENLLVENCRFTNTAGTAPQAGVDLEPNNPGERLVNCVLRNCRCEGNAGPGLFLYLAHLSGKSADLSVRVENCVVRNCPSSFGIGGGAIGDDGPGGYVEFRGVSVEGTAGPGAYVHDKSAGGAVFRFVKCRFKSVGRKYGPPLVIARRRPKLTKRPGGVAFVDCTLQDDKDRPALVFEHKGPEPVAVSDLSGTIAVGNPHGVRIDLGPKTENVRLEVRASTE